MYKSNIEISTLLNNQYKVTYHMAHGYYVIKIATRSFLNNMIQRSIPNTFQYYMEEQSIRQFKYCATKWG